jgi:malate dehydrogenase
MDKVTIFGAGHVGATTAFYLAMSATLDIAMIDIEEGKATGLAIDIGQAMPYTGSTSNLVGGGDHSLVEGSDLVVITAGFPRTPGMSRLDLAVKNAPIIKGIAASVAKLAPDAIIINVTNPVDEMTYAAWKASGFDEKRVIGMAGVLDTSRFMYFLKTLGGLDTRDMNAMVMGSHGDDMVPLTDWSKAANVPLSKALDPDKLGEIVQRTQDGGAEIVGYLKTGSAYYAPAVSIGAMALAILGDTNRVLPASAYLRGEYGVDGIFLGVPAKLGRGGITEVVEVELTDDERANLLSAATGIRKRVEESEGAPQ